MLRNLFTGVVLAMTATAAVKIEKTAYAGWPNCYRVTNGEVELIVTTDVGPRVIRYGFVGGQNIFKEFTPQMGKSGEKEWMPRGGHRVWAAPEHKVITYALDNGPVKAEIKGDTIELTQPVEPESGLQKQIVVKLAATGSKVEVIHRLTNTGTKLNELAPWALTMMAQGGTAITGFPPRGVHPRDLDPTNPLTMWAYTDFSDPRWKFMKKYLVLKQDRTAKTAQKTGLFNKNTWGAYLLGSDLFIKRCAGQAGKPYPDFGVSFETFTNNEFLELETLGPLQKLPKGSTAEHTERWSLHKNVQVAQWSDDGLDTVVLPLVEK
jgi:hypothetical protein